MMKPSQGHVARRLASRDRRIASLAVLTALPTIGACALARPVTADAPSRAPSVGLDDDGPLLFSWQPPLGDAADDGRFIEFVRVKTHMSPEAAADNVINQIRQRDLRGDQIAIVLQNFGMGHGDPNDRHDEGPSLYGHWSDALPHKSRTRSNPALEPIASEDASPRWWDTPWMSNGIEMSGAWMDRFLGRYAQRRSADSSIPIPARFHFDTEERPIVERPSSTAEFRAMMNDPRWDTEPIPGFDGRTLAQLYAEAGSPTVDPRREYRKVPNREWARWYGGVLLTACDAAMDAAAYSRIRAAFPGTLSSNYKTSEHFDGVSGRYQPGKDQFKHIANRAFGDLQAPVHYSSPPREQNVGESGADAALRRARLRLAVNTFSGGEPDGRITPWTLVPGEDAGRGSSYHMADERFLAEMLATYRWFGIREVLLWSGPQTQRNTRGWDAADRALASAWGVRVDDARMLSGSAEHRTLGRLRRAWDDPVSMQSAGGGSEHRVGVSIGTQVTEAIEDARALRLDIVAEAFASGTGASADIPLTVVMIDEASGRRTEGDRVDIEDGPARWTFALPAGDLADGDRFRFELEWSGRRSFAVDLDLVQATVDTWSAPVAARSSSRSSMRISASSPSPRTAGAKAAAMKKRRLAGDG